MFLPDIIWSYLKIVRPEYKPEDNPNVNICMYRTETVFHFKRFKV